MRTTNKILAKGIDLNTFKPTIFDNSQSSSNSNLNSTLVVSSDFNRNPCIDASIEHLIQSNKSTVILISDEECALGKSRSMFKHMVDNPAKYLFFCKTKENAFEIRKDLKKSESNGGFNCDENQIPVRVIISDEIDNTVSDEFNHLATDPNTSSHQIIIICQQAFPYVKNFENWKVVIDETFDPFHVLSNKTNFTEANRQYLVNELLSIDSTNVIKDKYYRCYFKESNDWMAKSILNNSEIMNLRKFSETYIDKNTCEPQTKSIFVDSVSGDKWETSSKSGKRIKKTVPKESKDKVNLGLIGRMPLEPLWTADEIFILAHDAYKSPLVDYLQNTNDGSFEFIDHKLNGIGSRTVHLSDRVEIIYMLENQLTDTKNNRSKKFNDNVSIVEMCIDAVDDLIKSRGIESAYMAVNDKHKAQLKRSRTYRNERIQLISSIAYGYNSLSESDCGIWLCSKKTENYQMTLINDVVGISRDIIDRNKELEAMYQFEMRGNLRALDSNQKFCCVVADRVQADYLRDVFYKHDLNHFGDDAKMIEPQYHNVGADAVIKEIDNAMSSSQAKGRKLGGKIRGASIIEEQTLYKTEEQKRMAGNLDNWWSKAQKADRTDAWKKKQFKKYIKKCEAIDSVWIANHKWKAWTGNDWKID
ncbi:hypothetical protein [Vibrio harveyi]